MSANQVSKIEGYALDNYFSMDPSKLHQNPLNFKPIIIFWRNWLDSHLAQTLIGKHSVVFVMAWEINKRDSIVIFNFVLPWSKFLLPAKASNFLDLLTASTRVTIEAVTLV